MRSLVTVISVICFTTASYAELYSQYNSASRTAIVLYTPDAQGFYHKQTNVSVNHVNNIEAQYAFDKKNKKLYVATAYGNYVIELTESVAKRVKKNKLIPQVKDKDIDALVVSVNNSLDEKFAKYNLERELFITDSIERAKEKERFIALEKARQDSIEKANKQAEINSYRAAHDWHWLPIKKKSQYSYSNLTETVPLDCSLCDKRIASYGTDSIYVVAINNDTIYSLESTMSNLGHSYIEVHACKVPSDLKTSEYYNRHINIYADSVFSNPQYNKELAQSLNYSALNGFIEAITKEAPYGFIVDWGWDSSGYFVAGDASKMQLTKIVITYMNGQQQTISQNNIVYDY